MPQRAIQWSKGEYYHIYNRGARRVSIFREARNYEYVRGLMRQVAEACELTILAYCLLPNHYHWLVRQDGETAAGVLPKRVFGSYSQAYNRAYGESGTLFQGPYSARHVATDAYLRHLCVYIHANPVKHGIVDSLEQWPYSNDDAWMNEDAQQPECYTFMRSLFGTAAHYAEVVQAYTQRRRPRAKELQRIEAEIEDDFNAC